MAHIDTYLDMLLAEQPTRTVYFIFEAEDGFDPKTIPNLQVGGKLGRIQTGEGTKATIDALRQCREVIRVEASR